MKSLQLAACAALAATCMMMGVGCSQGTLPPPEPTTPAVGPIPTGDPAAMEKHPPAISTPREPSAGEPNVPHSN